MRAGEFIRKAYKLYLGNPLIVLPFILYGVMDFFGRHYISLKFGDVFTSFDVLAILGNISDLEFLGNLIGFYLLLIAVIVLLSFVSSFIEAFAIGFARSVITSGPSRLKEGMKTLKRGLHIFAMKLLVVFMIVFAAIVVYLPLTVLFKELGVLITVAAVLIFSFAVLVATFFAAQSIVLERNGPINGIRSSYRMIRNNPEDVAVIIVFILLAYVCLMVIETVSVLSMGYLTGGMVLELFSTSMRLILFSMVFAPYVLILKTVYFIKNLEK